MLLIRVREYERIIISYGVLHNMTPSFNEMYPNTRKCVGSFLIKHITGRIRGKRNRDRDNNGTNHSHRTSTVITREMAGVQNIYMYNVVNLGQITYTPAIYLEYIRFYIRVHTYVHSIAEIPGHLDLEMLKNFFQAHPLRDNHTLCLLLLEEAVTVMRNFQDPVILFNYLFNKCYN